MSPDPKMVEKLLLHAAEILEAGWCRNNLAVDGQTGLRLDPALAQAGVDRFCMAGAMMRAREDIYGGGDTGPPLEYNKALELVADQMPMGVVGFGGSLSLASIPYFNDYICQSGEEAGALFRKVAGGLA